MTFTLSRRQALVGTAFAVPALASLQIEAKADGASTAEAQLAALEREHGGRLGVAMLNLSTGASAAHRGDERFLMCSTFKTLLSAFILSRVDREEESLDRRITYTKEDLVSWSPVTEKHVGAPGMSVAALCEATVTISDNAAANLLLAESGGPAGLTAFLRGLGDEVTRLDRIEPALNAHDGPDDLRDTTTPAAMLETMRKLFFTEVLSRRGRSQLTAWHLMNRTGDKRLRAGLPPTWLVGDKTGTSGKGEANHVAVAWPTDRGPVIVSAYCAMPEAPAETHNKVLAAVARIAAAV